jgi:hypothetical protein
MANIYSQSIGGGINANGQGISIDDSRRVFNFGERVAELNPAASPFFAYLSKVAKKPTDDPVFKFLEKRHQWQRRNFLVDGNGSNVTVLDGSTAYSAGALDIDGVNFDVDYDIYGRKTGTAAKVEFATPLQVFVVKGVLNDGADKDILLYYRIKSSGDAGVTQGTDDTAIKAVFLKAVYVPKATQATLDAAVSVTQAAGEVNVASLGASDTVTLVDNAPAQIIGSAHAEGSTAPDGWRDEFYSREGYTQIFKTSVPLFSGSSLATRYRGDANEYMRVYQEKLMEHKMDIENALLFGYGSADESPTSGGPVRKTWGILPYTEIYGSVKQFTYDNSGYDTFVDAMSEIFDPESAAGGNKLVLASRSIMNWLNKLGGQSFLGNTMASNSGMRANLDKNAGMFDGVPVTTVDTMYGTLNFVMEPLLRGPWADHAVAIDLSNVAYRPLAGNGESRDTQIITNVQNNDIDGRKDMILTESGLEISLPETHAVLKFNTTS